MICDGATVEQLRQHLRRHLDANGFAALHVEGGVGQPPWSYTVGLEEKLFHPELVVVGATPETASVLLHELVDRIRVGERLTPGTPISLNDGSPMEFAAVHRRQFLLGVFAARDAYYALDPLLRVGHALQVLPAELPRHGLASSRPPPRLDLPVETELTRRANRDDRRRRQGTNRRNDNRHRRGRWR